MNKINFKLKCHKLSKTLQPFDKFIEMLAITGIFSKKLGKIGIGLNISKSLLNILGNIDFQSEINHLQKIEISLFKDQTVDILKNHHSFESANYTYSISNIDGVNFYWTVYATTIHVWSSDLSILKNKILKTLFLDNAGLYVEQKENYQIFTLPINNENNYIGNKAKEIEVRLNNFNNNRSVILYGEPGTGKSTIAQHLAQRNNNKFICISISNLKISTLLELSQYFNQNEKLSLIIDDFHKIENKDAFLSGMGQLKEKYTTVIATMNNYENLDLGLIRPKRFDDHFKIDKLENEFVDFLLGDNKNKISSEYYEKIINWPAAYISDLNDRINKLGINNINEEFKDLETRLNFQRKKCQI